MNWIVFDEAKKNNCECLCWPWALRIFLDVSPLTHAHFYFARVVVQGIKQPQLTIEGF